VQSYSSRQRSSFGQRVRGYSQRRSESSGGGGGGLSTRWNARFKPPQNTTTKFRLLPGSYIGFEGLENEYFPYVEHFVARSQRGFICSKEYKIVEGELTTVGGKCLGCEERDRGAEDVSWRMLHAFNGIHLEYYHLEPVVDDNGKAVCYEKGRRQGEQILRKVECEGRRCKMCKEGLEKVFGKKVHWSIGSGHLNDLAGFVTEIEKDCDCGGRLEEVLYECSDCAEPLIDLNKTDLTDKEINRLVAHKQECKCGHVDFLLRQVECDKCQDPTSLSIFDCDLEIKRQGEGTNSTVQIPRWIPTELDEALVEMAKPWPMKKIFSADDFKWQAKVLKIRNPYGDDAEGKGGKGKDAEDHTEDYGSEDYSD